MPDDSMSSHETRQRISWGLGIALGMGVGVSLGVALDDMGAGIAAGLAVGVVVALLIGRRRRPKGTTDPGDHTPGGDG